MCVAVSERLGMLSSPQSDTENLFQPSATNMAQKKKKKKRLRSIAIGGYSSSGKGRRCVFKSCHQADCYWTYWRAVEMVEPFEEGSGVAVH